MSGRKALLLGVHPYTGSQVINAVPKDLKLVGERLAQREFELMGPIEPRPWSRNQILKAIRGFLRNAAEGDDLVFYFTGHGIHVAGGDYLVPADSDLEDSANLLDYLVPLDLAGDVENSKARRVLFVIDACRQGVTLPSKASVLQWGLGKRQSVKNRQFGLLLSCQPGHLSYYSDDGSIFSQALADTLAAGGQGASLLLELKARMAALAIKHGKEPQVPRFVPEDERASDLTWLLAPQRLVATDSLAIFSTVTFDKPFVGAVATLLLPDSAESIERRLGAIRKQFTSDPYFARASKRISLSGLDFSADERGIKDKVVEAIVEALGFDTYAAFCVDPAVDAAEASRRAQERVIEMWVAQRKGIGERAVRSAGGLDSAKDVHELLSRVGREAAVKWTPPSSWSDLSVEPLLAGSGLADFADYVTNLVAQRVRGDEQLPEAWWLKLTNKIRVLVDVRTGQYRAKHALQDFDGVKVSL